MTVGTRLEGSDEVAVDVVVVGAGVAGLVTALDLLDRAPAASIAVVDKGAVGASGSTPLAQGGMAAALGPQDSPERHAADTLRAGDGLCDPRAVAVLTAEAPARVADLRARGVVFDRDASGALDLAREGGQSVPRCVHVADATGAEIFRGLREAAAGRLTRVQGTAAALALAETPAAPVAGVWVLLDDLEENPSGPAQRSGLALLRARAVVLATGGCGGCFAATTNRPSATGDGVALAAGAGAGLVDLEFMQFHPTGLAPGDGDEPPQTRLLLTEALRGAGAVLVDAAGRRFMPERHPDAELAPRHVVTRAILEQPGGAWLDATTLGAERLAAAFPTVLAGARAHGYDLASDPAPVEPCQHYMIGGIATDLWGRTSLAGLSAVGEVACTGVHGANRMAGNSLAQSCVFAHRTAVRLADGLEDSAAAPAPAVADPPALQPADAASEAAAAHSAAAVRTALSGGAGPLRSGPGLATAAKSIAEAAAAAPSPPTASRAGIELAHQLVVAGLLVRSAELRAESRGVHWREDAPERVAAWQGVRLRVQQPSAPGGDR